MNEESDFLQARKDVESLVKEISKVIIGKEEVIKMMIVAMIASGHVLFDDIPGVGKTTMVRALSKAVDLDFKRLQFTPDLMPADILGASIFDQKTSDFSFKKGPIFTTILLADEINRATPRTQSALLEGMSDLSVTIDNEHFDLDPDFFVLGTENPLAFEGTYPLPEAQLDRFLMKLSIGYPKYNDELSMIFESKLAKDFKEIKPVIDRDQLKQLKKLINKVHLAENVAKYALNLVTATRKVPEVKLGISPRGTLALIQAAKAYAVSIGEDYVSPETIQKVIDPVFSHRLIMKEQYEDNIDSTDILKDIVAKVEVPIR